MRSVPDLCQVEEIPGQCRAARYLRHVLAVQTDAVVAGHHRHQVLVRDEAHVVDAEVVVRLLPPPSRPSRTPCRSSSRASCPWHPRSHDLAWVQSGEVVEPLIQHQTHLALVLQHQQTPRGGRVSEHGQGRVGGQHRVLQTRVLAVLHHIAVKRTHLASVTLALPRAVLVRSDQTRVDAGETQMRRCVEQLTINK
jgi:hypothetical protein